MRGARGGPDRLVDLPAYAHREGESKEGKGKDGYARDAPPEMERVSSVLSP